MNVLLGNYTIMAYKVTREIQILAIAFEDHMPETMKNVDSLQEFTKAFLKIDPKSRVNFLDTLNKNFSHGYQTVFWKFFKYEPKDFKSMFEPEILRQLQWTMMKIDVIYSNSNLKGNEWRIEFLSHIKICLNVLKKLVGPHQEKQMQA